MAKHRQDRPSSSTASPASSAQQLGKNQRADKCLRPAALAAAVQLAFRAEAYLRFLGVSRSPGTTIIGWDDTPGLVMDAAEQRPPGLPSLRV